MWNFNEKLGLSFAFFVALLFALGGGGSLHAQADSGYSIIEPKNVMVAMRDGVQLATDIYRPGRNAQPIGDKFPVILMRTAYNKESTPQIANTLVPHGYVVVLQDVRGRYKPSLRVIGVRTSTIPTMVSIPPCGLVPSGGVMVASELSVARTRVPHNMRSLSATLLI